MSYVRTRHVWSRLTVIGVIAGSIIIGVGAASLVLHLGPIEIYEQHHIMAGEAASYLIPAPEGTAQSMSITGDRFNVTLSSPGPGLQVDNTEYRGEAVLSWTHAESGDTAIQIRNTGSGSLAVEPDIIRTADPVWIAFDFMVVISGIIIIGFSMGFAVRRPRGF